MNARGGFLLFVPIVGLLVLPIVGWPAVVRLPALLVPALVMGLLTVRPWKWSEVEFRALDRWEPSPRQVLSAAFLAGAVLFWIVLTRFESGAINALDFTVYFDRPCFQTLQGRPLLVETAYGEEYSHRSLLAVHAFWALLPMCSLYAIHVTPLWLLGLSVMAVVIGAVHVLRIMQHLRAGGVLASATALAFMLNDNTARTLNYGFHPEVLYAWFVPWMIDAALRRSRLSFVAATLACVLVTDWVEAHIGETLNFYSLPRQHHKHLKSTNILERLNEEIKRRTRVVRIFPNPASCLRLVRALCAETHEGWLEDHRYLNMDFWKEQKKDLVRVAA